LEEFFQLDNEFSAGVLCVDVECAAHLGDADINTFIKT